MSRYYTRQETLIKHPAALNEGSLCLLGLHGIDKNHTRGIYVAVLKTTISEICKISIRLEQSVGKRLYMSRLFPPNSRFI